MSGTSADGINVALADFTGRGLSTRFRLRAHREFPFPAAVRKTILTLMNASDAGVPDLARLNFLLGELYAQAVAEAQRRAHAGRLELIGCHGQTLYHQGDARRFLGHALACTWQTGEAAVIAARLGVPVVSDFRVADMAAGGKGAPLVPFFDFIAYRDRSVGRSAQGVIAQNLGGIGNLTAIGPHAKLEDVLAFDTGPGNMVIDALSELLVHKKYDRDGRIAARGEIIEGALAWALRRRFFQQTPPRTAGREEFGREFVAGFLRACGRARPRNEDVLATATALTARSISHALCRFVLHDKTARYRDYIVSGGGTRNRTLMRMLAAEVAPLGLRIRSSDEFGIPSAAKEALAFALLAYQTWQRQPGNVPSATGAKRAVVLGKISFP